MYSSGLGTTKNNAKAIEWYKKSTEQGYPKAQYNLGLMYHVGEGTLKNYQKAYTHF